MSENTAIEKVNVSMIMSEGVGASYCSIDATSGDIDSKKQIYKALNNPDNKISDFINKQIVIRDVLVEVSQIANEESGEVDTVPRVVLIDVNGKAYQAVSKGIFSAICNAIQVFGQPTWEDGIAFEVKQKQVGRGTMLTLDIV